MGGKGGRVSKGKGIRVVAKQRKKSLLDDPKPLVLSHLIIFVIAQHQLRWLPQVCKQKTKTEKLFCVPLARFPIARWVVIGGSYSNTDQYNGGEMYMMTKHTPCPSRNAGKLHFTHEL